MSTYVIGDLQGCFFALENLLEKIHFNSDHDILWFTGDLVNRGPESLETLRFVKQLGKQQRVVLGNHDLHLLAVAEGAHGGWPDDTLTPILEASDRAELMDWLRHQPLLHHDEVSGFVMVHAGLAPDWDLSLSKKLAAEVEAILQSDQRMDFFHHMYGNTPSAWHENLTGWDRIRCIVNYLTRARFCHPDGSLELKTKENVREDQTDLVPWFKLPDRRSKNLDIVFGHWAALGGVTNTPHEFALDTGCVWGYSLTAMRLEDRACFSVGCK